MDDTISPFFTSEPENLEIRDFQCRYDQQLSLGETVQLYLEIYYEDKEEVEFDHNFLPDGYTGYGETGMNNTSNNPRF